MDDEGDRQTRAKRKRSKRADKVGGGGDTKILDTKHRKLRLSLVQIRFCGLNPLLIVL